MSERRHRTLRTDAEIQAYLHRTRMEILTQLRDGPATGSQLGQKLGVHPANLTRHIRALVDAGLVELAETKDTGRNLEKYYAATADSFDVAPQADLEAPHLLALEFARSDLAAAVARLSVDERRTVMALVSEARIAPEDIARFCSKLEELLKEFRGADGEGRGVYHLNLSLYPSDGPLENRPPVSLGRENSKRDEKCRER
jgi:DNA-binding transcriptional ArsR family regulator